MKKSNFWSPKIHFSESRFSRLGKKWEKRIQWFHCMSLFMEYIENPIWNAPERIGPFQLYYFHQSAGNYRKIHFPYDLTWFSSKNHHFYFHFIVFVRLLIGHISHAILETTYFRRYSVNLAPKHLKNRSYQLQVI